MNRRLFCTLPLVSPPPSVRVTYSKPVNSLTSDTLYTYRNDRFQALFLVSDDSGRAVTVRRRVDWYDPLSEETKSIQESVMYITDIGGEL
jgi:hypothetical protein